MEREEMTLNFNEISDHKKFEDLAVAYFEDSKLDLATNIIDVEIKPSGVGSDGGRDILINFNLVDNIASFKQRWIVQCKFHNSDISTDKVADINIPTLIHSYNACGYLLICRKKPTSKLTQLFERLEENCKFNSKYKIWSGEQFKKKIITNKRIIQQFFPKYHKYLNKLNKVS